MSESKKDFPLMKDQAAQLLAERGGAANREAARRFSTLRKQFRDPPLFTMAVVGWLAECFPVKNKG